MRTEGDVSLPPAPVSRAVSMEAAAAGGALVVLHFGLLAANQWLILDQLRAQVPPHLQAPLAGELLWSGLRTISAEATALAAALLVTGHIQGGIWALLLSYAPIVLHSTGVAAALLSGWMLDLWLLSDGYASASDIAGTIREALPVVLEPFTVARHVVNGAAAVLLLWMLRRGGATAGRAFAAAVIFGIVLTAARLA